MSASIVRSAVFDLYVTVLVAAYLACIYVVVLVSRLVQGKACVGAGVCRSKVKKNSLRFCQNVLKLKVKSWFCVFHKPALHCQWSPDIRRVIKNESNSFSSLMHVRYEQCCQSQFGLDSQPKLIWS